MTLASEHLLPGPSGRISKPVHGWHQHSLKNPAIHQPQVGVYSFWLIFVLAPCLGSGFTGMITDGLQYTQRTPFSCTGWPQAHTFIHRPQTLDPPLALVSWVLLPSPHLTDEVVRHRGVK